LFPLGWRARRSWRRTARRLVAEHIAELLSRLDGLRGLPVCGLATSSAGSVRVTFPGWIITVAGVATGAQAALTAAAEQHDCYLSDTGMYGRFWWVAEEYNLMGNLSRTVILGSRLVLTTTNDGDPRPRPPDVSALLIASYPWRATT
jgi:hypothetical protein